MTASHVAMTTVASLLPFHAALKFKTKIKWGFPWWASSTSSSALSKKNHNILRKTCTEFSCFDMKWKWYESVKGWERTYYFSQAWYLHDCLHVPLVVALVPLKCYSRYLQIPHRDSFTKEKMPWCPWPFQKRTYTQACIHIHT